MLGGIDNALFLTSFGGFVGVAIVAAGLGLTVITVVFVATQPAADVPVTV